MSDVSDDVKKRHVVNAADARAQASEDGYGFLKSEFRRANPTPEHPDGEVFEIPHKDLFDQEQQERYDDLLEERQGYDREDDVFTANGALIAKGNLKYPYMKGGKRVTVKLGGKTLKATPALQHAIVLWGEEGAARANAGGIIFNEIDVIWGKQYLALEERQKADPKS